MQQLIKFCLVGASSTVIHQGLLWILLRIAPEFPWWASHTIGFLFGVSNGFFWNQRWTFASRTEKQTHKQFPKFIVTNVIALGLNLAITKGFLYLFTGQVAHGVNPPKDTVQLASICAIPFGVVWTFSCARFWTFRPPSQPSTSALVTPHVTSSE